MSATQTEFQTYLPISKVDKTRRMVWGYASTPSRDLDGEVIELEAIRRALPDYMEWANIREMHQPSAVGVAKEARVDDRGLWIGAKIGDDVAWQKVLDEIYKGFSIGGIVKKQEGSTIIELQLIEISLVDRPANPDCRIQMVKGASVLQDSKATLVSHPALAAESEVVLDAAERSFLSRMFAKLGLGKASQPMDGGVIPGKETKGGDGLSSPAGQLEGGEDNNPHESQVLKEDGAGDFGDVHYADPGYQSDGKKRYPVDTEEHIRAAWSYIHMPRNAEKYSPEHHAHVVSAIESAWKDKIDPAGPPSATDKTLHTTADALVSVPWALESALRAAATLNLGDQTMATETTTEKRRSSLREHMAKAAGHLAKAAECHGAACAHMEALHNMVRTAAMKAKAGDATAMGAMDPNSALEHCVGMKSEMSKMADYHEMAAHHMEKAASENLAAPAEAEGASWNNNGQIGSGGNMTEGDVPEYDPTKPYAGKSAMGLLVWKMQETAFLKGKNSVLEKLPAGGGLAKSTPKTFDISKSGVVSEITGENKDLAEQIMEGVVLGSEDPDVRKASTARMIGNMIVNGAGRNPLFDATFRGGAGR